MIYSDSKGALELIKEFYTHMEDSIIYKILKTATITSLTGHEICFLWLPSQVGVSENEAADELAAAAPTKNMFTPATFSS